MLDRLAETGIDFVVPGPIDQRTGGYIYDRRIVLGLGARGVPVRVRELCGPAPSAEAGRLIGSLADGAVVVIDALALAAFADPLPAHARRLTAVALVHHPASQETGLAAAEAAALRAGEVRALAAVGRVIAASRFTARTLKDFGVEEGKIAVVEPGTDPAPRARGSGGPEVRILCVGAVAPRKGQWFLIRALAGVRDLDWRLVCVGSFVRGARYDEDVLALAKELRIDDRVTFVGELGPEALEAEYQKADLFALPTLLEGYGMALAEALARGLPIATTTVGPIPELVPIEASVQAPPGNAPAFSKAIRRVICDPELRARMAEAAWQAGQRLPHWEVQVALFADALARAAGGAG